LPETPLFTMATLPRLAAIGVITLGAAGAFAYAGGWLSPERLTQARVIAAFEALSSGEPGFRRNHAKGVCVTGWFDSSGQAAALSKAALFAPAAHVPVIGRFSLAGAMAFQPDKPNAVRSLALQLRPTDAPEWRIAMIDLPVFPVNSPEAFYEQLVAARPDPATGKPDPAKRQAFITAHPETVRAMALIGQRQISSGFSDDTYNSLNAFRFVNAAGEAVPVRWAAVPAQPVAAPDAAQAAGTDKNYLFDAVARQMHEQKLQWRIVVTVGQPGDPTADATLPWPAERRQVEAGTVTLDKIESEATGPCTDVNFDPLVLPPGIEASDDPLLSARSAAYARSFTLREGEHATKPASAVSAAELQAGAQP
jgi:catalase